MHLYVAVEACPGPRFQPTSDGRFRALVERHVDFVGRSLRRLGARPADIDDAAQEVFVVAARRLDDIAEDRERAFLFGTAARVCSTRRRTARRRPEELYPSADEHARSELDPEELAALRQGRALLERILDGMGRDFRTVFVLAELEELSVPEMAQRLAVPEGTVSSRLRTAREQFRAGVKRTILRERFARSRLGQRVS